MTAFLFAATHQDADDSAVADWKWERHNAIRTEFLRPDSRQVVRFVPDMDGTMTGFAWNTRVYLGRNWERRRDKALIQGFIDSGFFKVEDPELPALRPPRRNRLERLTSELRSLLGDAERPAR